MVFFKKKMRSASAVVLPAGMLGPEHEARHFQRRRAHVRVVVELKLHLVMNRVVLLLLVCMRKVR